MESDASDYEDPFADLVAAANQDNDPFADLIESHNSSKKKVRNKMDAMAYMLPGKFGNEMASFSARTYLDKENAKKVDKFLDKYTRPLGDVIDTALKTYGSYATGVVEGVPVLGSFLDEGYGYANHLAGGDYEQSTNNAREFFKASREYSPKFNLAGNIVGGLAPAAVYAPSLLSGGGTLLNMAKAGGAGGIIGYGHTLGLGDGDFSQRKKAAKEAGYTAGVISSIIPGAGTAIKSTVKAAPKLVPQGLRKKFADDELLKALRAEGLTPREAFSLFNRARKGKRLHSNSFAESPVSLSDVGENLNALGRAVTTHPGPARKVAGDFLMDRQKGQHARLTDALERSLRQKSKDNFYQAQDKLISQQKKLSGPAYEQAYKNAKGVQIGDLLTVWRDRASQTSLAIGKKMNAAIKDVARSERVNNPQRALAILNGAKQGLDDAIMRARIKSPNLTRELTKMKNELLRRVDGANPDYKKARAVYSGPAALLDAQNVGRSFAKGDTELTAKTFKAMSRPEQEMFRKGVIQDLRKKMGAKQYTHDRTALFNTPNAREVLRAVFPGNTKKFKPFQQFIDLVETEAKFVTTKNKILGGSPTAQRLAEAREFDVSSLGNFAKRMRDGEWSAAVLSAIATKAQQAWSMKAKDAEAIAKLLFDDNPINIARTLKRLHKQYGRSKVQRAIKEIGEFADKNLADKKAGLIGSAVGIETARQAAVN